MSSKTFLFIISFFMIGTGRLLAQNNCLDFDPSANALPDYVQSATTPISGDNNFTIETRFLLPATNTGTSARRLLAFGGGVTRFEIAELGGLLRVYKQGTSGTLTSNQLNTINYRDGQWHHIAVTKNGFSIMAFVDGVAVNAIPDLTAGLASATFRVGAPVTTTPIATATWDGLVDEVRVWNTARSLTQINAVRNCGLVGNEAGLVLYYNFNQGTAGGNNAGLNTANDLTTNANNGTLGGFFNLTGNTSNWVLGDPNFSASCVTTNCTANFTFTIGNCGQVAFTNTTPPTVSGTFSWNFGDPASGTNNTSTAASPTHVFTAPGNYQVCLTLTTSAGVACTTCKTVAVQNIDNQGPVVTCKNATLTFTNSNPILLGPPDVFVSLTDNCCPANQVTLQIVSGQTTYTCADVCLPPKTVVLQATDCSGNTGTCTATVTCVDAAPPIARCTTAVIGVNIGTLIPAPLSANSIDNGSVDNCSIVTRTVSPASFSCPTPCPSTQTVTMTVTDCSGNASSCTAQVRVSDGLPPTLTCPPNATIPGTLGPNGCFATYTIPVPTVTDNCPAGVAVTCSVNGGPNTTPGQTTTLSGTTPSSLVYTAVDGCSNRTTCTQTVTVNCSNCTCGAFTNMALNELRTPPVGLSPLRCDTNYQMPCPVAGKKYSISYAFGCSPASSCSPTDMAYSIVNTTTGATVVPLTALGGVTAVPIDGNLISAAGTYEVTIQGNCGGNICRCRVQLVVNCTSDCACGFSNVEFKDPDLPAPIRVICGQTPVGLKCTAGKTYTVSGSFNCTPASCAASNIGWMVMNSSGVTVASGTIGSAGPFSVAILGNAISTPGIYTLTLKGTCGATTCTCSIKITVSGCGPCECGTFSNLMIARKTTTPTPVKVNLACGQTASMPCPVEDHNWNLSGAFACVGDCQPTNMKWEIKNSTGTTVANGIMSASPFSVYFNGDVISTPGTYTLTMLANCGTQVCRCVVQLVVDCPVPTPVDTLCGRAILTCFSGSYPTGPNPNGYVLGLYDVRDHASQFTGLNFASASAGAIHGPDWKRNKIGEVFGVTTANDTSVYLASTSLFGNYPAGPAGYGGIYKINLPTLAVSQLVTTGIYAQNAKFIPNQGSALGNICYDPAHNQLFATNHADGMIYRIGMDGRVKSRFDPFTTANLPDPIDNTFVILGERLWGIGYNKKDGRVYFCRWNEHQGSPLNSTFNQIYSVGLTVTGEFVGTSILGDGTVIGGNEILEKELSDYAIIWSYYQNTNPVSDIAFSENGLMLISQRTMQGNYVSTPAMLNSWAHNAIIVEYQRNTTGQWEPTPGHILPDNTVNNLKYKVGALGSYGAGGVDYGYRSFDSQSMADIECDEMIWATTDRSNFPERVFGLQGMKNTGGVAATSVLVDADNVLFNLDKIQIGDVAIIKCISCVSTPPCDSIVGTVTPVRPTPGQSGTDCCYRINMQNAYPNTFAAINVVVDGASLAVGDVQPNIGWNISSFVSGVSASLEHSSGYLPTGSFSPGVICLSNITAPEQTITLQYLDNQGNVLCDDVIKVKCPYCLTILEDSIKCNEATGQWTMEFCINLADNLGWNANSLVLTPPPGVTITPAAVTLPNLSPTSPTYCVPVTFTITAAPGTNLDYGCIGFTIHEADVTMGFPPLRCCTVEKCYEFPDCCPNFATAMPVDTSGGNCCWKFTINQPAGTAQFLTINVIPTGSPVEISSVTNTGGWNTNLGNFPQGVTFSLNPSASLPATTTTPTVCFDVPDGSPSPQQLQFVWSTREAVLCYDTLEIDCNPYSECASIDSIRLVCNPAGGQTYTIKVMNNTEPPVTVTHIAVVNAMPSVSVPNPTIIPVGTLLPGAMIAINIPVTGPAGSEVCFNLNLYRQTGPLTFEECCVTETKHCVTLRTCVPTFNLVSLYPNPTQGNVVLQFGEEGSVPDAGVRLRDVTGRLLYETAIPVGAVQYEVQVPESVQGLLFIELLERDRRIWTGKVVKQ